MISDQRKGRMIVSSGLFFGRVATKNGLSRLQPAENVRMKLLRTPVLRFSFAFWAGTSLFHAI
tara:strand:- start:317 stop:505 length:189 start_codon:yes stop_codon:yes gene_type:complete